MFRLLILFMVLLSPIALPAQKSKIPAKGTAERKDTLLKPGILSGLAFRSIGPALMAGRIADIAIDPRDEHTWFVAVGSGGIWKTVNAGVTWTPVFDQQTSYSIGCVTIDPSNSSIVWAGTGENVGGRHVGFGDGVYKSTDGGLSWTNMGLKSSEHISRIIVHPSDPDIVWVAAQGPLWRSGGERGLYKTTDGGKTWKRTLGDDQWIGVTEVVIDPRDPNRLYAATWQRHRTIAAYMGGGPGSGLHRSIDGGETWEPLKTGLPTSNMGKIGLAISPQQPDVLYAAIELDRRTGGVYRSGNRGTSWEKRSETVSGATGPHYYQELYASPHQMDRIYLMDFRIQVSEDGGRTFRQMKEEHKHSDNHAIAFKASDPDFLLVGCDGGLYETHDLAENWRFFANMPVTQFYKVAVDDALPFYNIYGGTQDNSTQGGPSRTDNYQGIQNSDWRIVLDWDGHQPATEPGNPNVVYGQRQEGTLSRIDMVTGEVVDIQPQPAAGEPYERYNWDAPILVSPHSPTRIYFASQRLWRSDDRGDSWTVLSSDLTRNQERLALPIMGSTQSFDNPWDVLAMSNYNTITAIAESPRQAGLLYIGTDDGLIQITEDGGKTWRKMEITSLPGMPAGAYINDIKADLFNASNVYIALDNHKQGDFKPFLYRSTDKGRTWTSMAANLPDRHLVWRIVQDHVDPELFFLGTEFGIFFSNDGGTRWLKLQAGLPTIPFRDLAIQRRENDLVGASFGRSFYILDDYSPLRHVHENDLAVDAVLFPVRDAQWFIPRAHLAFGGPKGDQGAGHFSAPNPPSGAVFTYYLKEGLKTSAETRKEAEQKANKEKTPVAFPGWDTLETERTETEPRIWLVIQNANGEVVRRIPADRSKGIHRVNWDMTYPYPGAIALGQSSSVGSAPGMLAPPGIYEASLVRDSGGEIIRIAPPQSFALKPLRTAGLKPADSMAAEKFFRDFEQLIQDETGLMVRVTFAEKQANALQAALQQAHTPTGALEGRIRAVREKILAIQTKVNGSPLRTQMGEKTPPNMNSRMFNIYRIVGQSTYGPTQTAKNEAALIRKDMDEVQAELLPVQSEIKAIARELVRHGGPWIEGIDYTD